MEGKVITANRLLDGAVVYLAGDGAWVNSLAEARLTLTDEETENLLAAAADDVVRRIVIGPYAMSAADDDGGPAPLSQRERIRASGPTVRAAYS